MAKNKKMADKKNKTCCMNGTNCGGGIYGLGFIGSLVYYISTATGFWNGCWGLLKAFVWPAALVFEVLKYIGA